MQAEAKKSGTAVFTNFGDKCMFTGRYMARDYMRDMKIGQKNGHKISGTASLPANQAFDLLFFPGLLSSCFILKSQQPITFKWCFPVRSTRLFFPCPQTSARVVARAASSAPRSSHEVYIECGWQDTTEPLECLQVAGEADFCVQETVD